jgi:hypothetical protein
MTADGFVGVYLKAAAICSMLNDWSGMDVEKSVAYILSCQVLYHLQCVCLILHFPCFPLAQLTVFIYCGFGYDFFSP